MTLTVSARGWLNLISKVTFPVSIGSEKRPLQSVGLKLNASKKLPFHIQFVKCSSHHL